MWKYTYKVKTYSLRWINIQPWHAHDILYFKTHRRFSKYSLGYVSTFVPGLCWLNRSAFEWILVGAAIQPWGHPKKEKTKARPRVIRSKHNPLRTESIRLSLASEMQEACSWQRARDGRWMDENTLWHSGNSAGSFRWLILLSIKARP